jgi:hypothetical protein
VVEPVETYGAVLGVGEGVAVLSSESEITVHSRSFAV